LFWIAAEILILTAVVLGRRRLALGPPFGGNFRRQEWRLLFVSAAACALLTAVVLGRYLVLPQPVHLLEAGEDPALAASFYRLRLLQHLLLWSVFVVVWVLLEGLIVYQGWRGYRLLRNYLGSKPVPANTHGAVLGMLLLCAAGLLSAERAFAAPVEVLQASLADVQPYYNAMYLLLRVAGAAWVGIEWVAAVILVRSFLLLRKAAAEASS
jgi:hypothetical protein